MGKRPLILVFVFGQCFEPAAAHFVQRGGAQGQGAFSQRSVRIVMDTEQTAGAEAFVHMHEHRIGPTGNFIEKSQ